MIQEKEKSLVDSEFYTSCVKQFKVSEYLHYNRTFILTCRITTQKEKMMKKIELIHKEHNEECFEILKSTIIEDKDLEKFRIDKDTLLHELPENIVNEFLDFLSGFSREGRQLTLKMIKNGTLTLHCWEDEEDKANSYQVTLGRIKRERKEKSEQKFKNFDDNYLDIDTPF